VSAVLVLWTGGLPFDPVSAQIVRFCRKKSL